MARLTTIQQLADSYFTDGNYHHAFMYKASIPSAGTATMWVDASMSSGTPKYNAYAGALLESNQLIGTGNAGIFSGAIPSTNKFKYLARVGMATTSAVVPSYVLICDYLLFYPLIDGDSTDQQDMTNSIGLPRYTDGNGVRAFIVATTPGTTEGDVTINYVSHDDTNQSITFRLLIGASTGVIINGQSSVSTSGNNPFVPLSNGSRGVKAINSITNSSALGGFYCIVLAKPLTSLNIYETPTVNEVNLINDKFEIPRIYDGAYIHCIMKQGAAATGSYTGEFLFLTT
jgi:hypothetical protein